MYRVTKTYGHDLGMSACFRQPRAKSHCRHLHGYALSFKFVFEASTLDENNWVIDFGSLKPLRKKLEETFDHKTVVATDDPELNFFLEMHTMGVADVLVLPGGVGCEAFARHAWTLAKDIVAELGLHERVSVVSCEVREHGANSALYVAPHSERYA